VQLKQIADQAKAGPGPFPVSAYRPGPNETYQVARYNSKSLELLEAKISQFPRGTRFSLTTNSPQNQDQKQLEDEVQAFFVTNEMIFLPAAVPPDLLIVWKSPRSNCRLHGNDQLGFTTVPIFDWRTTGA
jgi:hypothetical protein